ncbi:MAG TPA: autoinducer binding domain-containing protein [Sphingomonas sp.]|nr:autoinducer binding domain-containing protein [Sphingomonas sp.]
MPGLARAQAFLDSLRQAKTADQLGDTLSEIAERMGFAYFALTHHVDPVASSAAIRLHNYPELWAEWFDANQLGATDPVHRASQGTHVGFAWSELDHMIRLTDCDNAVLDRARREGIGDGVTIPAHVPGEMSGSCSFAVRPDRDLPDDILPIAQLVGAFAFEAARRIGGQRLIVLDPVPALTARQRECVLWMARGKTDWEIAQILGVGHETVVEHLKQARERYDVPKRSLLAVRVLFDGQITFGEVFQR